MSMMGRKRKRHTCTASITPATENTHGAIAGAEQVDHCGGDTIWKMAVPLLGESLVERNVLEMFDIFPCTHCKETILIVSN